MTADLLEALVLGLAILLLASSCETIQPDYVEYEVWTQQGDGRFNRPVSNFEEETYGFGITVGYLWGQMRQGYANLAALDVNKSGELTMHERRGAETVVNVEQKQEQEADAESEAGAEAEAESASDSEADAEVGPVDIDLPADQPESQGGAAGAAASGPLSWLPAPPKTLEEAYPWLAWIAGVSFLLWVLSKTGLADRLIPKRKGGG